MTAPVEISREAAEAAEAAALQVPCGQCWQRRSHRCWPEGNHLGRYVRAHRKGLLDDAGLAAAQEHVQPGYGDANGRLVIWGRPQA